MFSLWGYLPHTFRGVIGQSEGDNYPNGLTISPWARWLHGASGQRHRDRDRVSAAPVPPGLPGPPFVVGNTQQALGRNM